MNGLYSTYFFAWTSNTIRQGSLSLHCGLVPGRGLLGTRPLKQSPPELISCLSPPTCTAGQWAHLRTPPSVSPVSPSLPLPWNHPRCQKHSGLLESHMGTWQFSPQWTLPSSLYAEQWAPSFSPPQLHFPSLNLSPRCISYMDFFINCFSSSNI